MMLAGTRPGPAARIPHHGPKDCQPPFGRGQPFGHEWTTAQGVRHQKFGAWLGNLCMAAWRMTHAKSEPSR